jgi:hypothetical protein
MENTYILTYLRTLDDNSLCLKEGNQHTNPIKQFQKLVPCWAGSWGLLWNATWFLKLSSSTKQEVKTSANSDLKGHFAFSSKQAMLLATQAETGAGEGFGVGADTPWCQRSDTQGQHMGPRLPWSLKTWLAVKGCRWRKNTMEKVPFSYQPDRDSPFYNLNCILTWEISWMGLCKIHIYWTRFLCKASI